MGHVGVVYNVLDGPQVFKDGKGFYTMVHSVGVTMVGDVFVLNTRQNHFSDESFSGSVFLEFLFLLIEELDDFLDQERIG